ncbi:ribosomal-protein-alanine acetyltransferase [Bacillus coahuilensis m2-6]|uniref:GNAT family N-acetyltransferase n=1 Tax=Bacillus coahuilensis TaxID=408580 RepID=UPI000750291E|nr:GNAT family protein [Bacillus coahuilensis]KUP09612.1 ribosomal-protein-alanine acetyltransferase [Bacillus coahuilensis m2-6]
MTFTIQTMAQEQAEEIAYNWHYEQEYDFYDMEADNEDLEEFLNPVTRGNNMFSVSEDNVLVGFLSVSEETLSTFEIGLGMRPDLTGQGMGQNFLVGCIEFVQKKFSPRILTLSVATFNQRAIKVYKKVGFKEIEVFMQETNGSQFEFVKMAYELKKK